MGLDGGTIPVRVELVKNKKKDDYVDKAALRRERFFHCAVSGNALQNPIVACWSGRLYNYESVLRALLEKRLPPELAQHIRSAQDVFFVRPKRNPLYTRGENEPVEVQNVSPWVCPVTGSEIGLSSERFVVHPKCGAVFSLRAGAGLCYGCGEENLSSSSDNDLVELVPADEAIAHAQQERARARKVAEKKKKKKKSEEEDKDKQKKKKKKEEKKSRKREREVESETSNSHISVAQSIAAKAAQVAEEKTKNVSSLFAKESSLSKLNDTEKFIRYA